MSLIRKSNQRTFLDIYPVYTDFIKEKNNLFNVFGTSLTDDSWKKTYSLLVAFYGDTPISGYRDEGRWKLKLFATIDAYGPTWETKEALQKTIRATDIEDFKKGNLSIYNTALNPNSEPVADSSEALTYINSQNTSQKQYSDYEAISRKWELLNDDLTKYYMDKFKSLFSKFVLADVPLYVYDSVANDEGE